MRRSCWRVVFLALVFWLHAGVPAPAEEPAKDPLGRQTPRGAMLGYLAAAREGQFERAAEYLDLQRLPEEQRGPRGPVLARQLSVVLNRALWVEPDALSADPEGQREGGVPQRLERVGTIATERGPVEILLERLEPVEGAPIWRFSAATVARIPRLYGQFGYGPLGEVLPEPFFDIRVFGVELWQWIGLAMVAAIAALGAWVGAFVLARLLAPVIGRFPAPFDREVVRLTIGPVRLGIALLLFSLGILPLALALPVQSFFSGAERGLLVVIVAWLLVRVTDLLTTLAGARLAARGRTAAVSMLPLGRKSAKAIVVGLAVLALLQNLGVNITGVLAGLGIGGLAVALAAQKTVENFFGGIMLITDQPVRVGDFCRFGDKIGIVEEIGLRSTRVRTLDRTVISVPNAEFATLQVENFAMRDRIWLRTTLGLRYETTPDQIRHVLVEIRKMLYAHPKVSPEPARIRFVGFGAYSLDLEIFAYVLTTDYGEFLSVREDIYLRIMDIVAASGTGFAFPSSTTYLGRDTGLDEAKGRAAEAQVRAWRAQGALCLPDFPPEAVADLRATLPYPPEGAATGGDARARP